MCGPVAVGVGMLAVSALSAYSQVQTGKANASIANANANEQNQAAKDAINTGNDQAYQQRQKATQLEGQQRAIMGASGTDLTSGNALDLTTQTAQGGELDALTTINNAQRQAAGLNFQASATRAQGSVDEQTADLGATTTLLNAPLKGYSAYKTFGGTWSPFSK